MAASETPGDRIRRYRQLKGWTQEELAFAAKIDRSNLGKIEAGRRDKGGRKPGAKVIGRIAKALGVQVRHLLEGTTAGDWYDDSKPPGTVNTMSEIEDAIMRSDIEDQQKNGLIISARLLVTPYLQEAKQRRRRRGQEHTA